MTASNKPLILADNLFENVVIHPNNLVTTNATTVAGSEYWNAEDNLRDLTQFTSGQTNTDINLTVDCGSAVFADTVVLDRGHNLKSQTVEIRASTDNFASSNVLVASCVVPASPGGLATDANGCLTKDSVWWKQWASVQYRYWRFVSKAMGASISPIITGLYYGLSYRFPDYLVSPGAYDFRIRNQALKNVVSQRGVRIRRRILNFSEIDLKFELEDADFQTLHPQVLQLLYYNHPWWFCIDDSVNVGGTDLMRLYGLGGDTTYDPQMDPVHRTLNFLLEEVIPSNVLL